MKESFVPHDVTYCSNEECSKKEKCSRYFTKEYFEELKEFPVSIAYFTENPPGHCAVFWEKNN